MIPVRASRSPGFTLLELMVSMIIVAVVLTAAIAASNAQQRVFFEGQRQRVAQGNARAALLYLEQKVPLAGWGLDPSLALDFQFYAPTAGTTCPTGMTCPLTRDRVGDADELVFYARNPAYWVPSEGQTGGYKGRAWKFTGLADATHANLDARAGDFFAKGQILQVICPAELKFAYMTVATNLAVTADANVSVELLPKVASNPFRRQDVAGSLTDCRTFQIDRYRFHVRPAGFGGATSPYLVLDRGIDVTGNADGTPDGVVDDKDEVIVAEGVEAFQVAYVLASPSLGSVGTTAGTAIAFGTTNADQTQATAGALLKTNFGAVATGDTKAVYLPSSFLTYRYSDPIRMTAHQANVRAIRIAMVVRSPEPNPSAPANITVDGTFTLLNQSGAPTWVTAAPKLAAGTDGYQRVRVESTVSLQDMTVRSIPAF